MDATPLMTYILITAFSPGPNNMLCLSSGMRLSYQQTLAFMMGIMSGVLLVMLSCAFLSQAILSLLPNLETYLRIIGASYILWLAWLTLGTQYHVNHNQTISFSFIKGFLLQFINTKGIIYGLTLYTTFLSSLAENTQALIISALLLALLTWIANSFWTLLGSRVNSYLNNETLKRYVNVSLSGLLVWVSLDILNVL